MSIHLKGLPKQKDSSSDKNTKNGGNWLNSILSNYNAIDPPLKDYFSRTILSLLVLLLFLSLICIAFAVPEVFLTGCIMILSLIGITFYRIQKCLENSVSRIEGVCEEVYIPTLRNKGLLKRDYLILRTEDDNFIKIFNVKHYKAKIDNSIVVYFPQNSIRKINDDTYQIFAFYWIYIAKRESKKKLTIFNQKKGIED